MLCNSWYSGHRRSIGGIHPHEQRWKENSETHHDNRRSYNCADNVGAIATLFSTLNNMKVKFKKLNEKAVMPTKAHDDDFCYDVVATSCEEIAPNVYRYGTGIALQIDEASQRMYARCGAVLGIDVRPRSSVHKTGMILSNGCGTVDAGYTGEISAVFYHVLPNLPKYEVGDRICQICIGYTYRMEFEEVDELSTTSRGAGGYGSTGK